MKAMKTFFRILAMVGLTVLLFSLNQCSTKDNSDHSTTVEVDMDRERSEIKEDLFKLRDDINVEIEKLDRKLEKATDDQKQRLNDANRRLTDERARVNEALNDIDEASEETWKEIKTAATNTSRDVKAGFQEWGNELNALFVDDKD